MIIDYLGRVDGMNILSAGLDMMSKLRWGRSLNQYLQRVSKLSPKL